MKKHSHANRASSLFLLAIAMVLTVPLKDATRRAMRSIDALVTNMMDAASAGISMSMSRSDG